MCYSAQIETEYRTYVRLFGADISLRDYVDIFWRRRSDSSITIPKGVEAAFADPQGEQERQIKVLIDEFHAEQALKLEQQLFKQRKRLVDAQRILHAKPTKKAEEERRIATAKVEWALGKLSDMRRTEHRDRDARIFPRHYAPVMVMDNGRRTIKPMRYQCRPAGKPVSHDTQYPGTYNARKDSLQGFWKGLFGHTHGLMLIDAFYENVNRHRAQGRDLREGEPIENLVLEFKPRPRQPMLIACLWSRWTGPGQPDLLSFAAITDEPPPEIAAAGHDRCIVPIRPEHIDAWLNPNSANLAAQHAILEDRARPYYEHRLAA